MIERENIQFSIVKSFDYQLSKLIGIGVLWLCFLLFSANLFAQNPAIPSIDTSSYQLLSVSDSLLPAPANDSIDFSIADSLVSAESELETTVEYTATDSTVMDVDGQNIYLYGNAQVDYGDIQLKADFIKLSWGTNEIFAHGMPDSTRKVGEAVKGKPIFSQGGEVYNTDTIRYNFKSRKALIQGIVTQEGEGIIQGERVKKDSVDNLYLVNAKYTTCDLAEPHFHIASKRIKLVNKKSIISGPFNFVLAGVPLPVGLPFGFFPVPKKKEIGTSGFVMGTYGEEPNNRGFYFRDFGYYHAFSEYIGAKVLAQIYSKGSWGTSIQSQYIRRYKYTGNLNLQFNHNKTGDELSLVPASNDFSLTWSHSPQNSRPDRSFSASVNLVSNGFNQNNRRTDNVDQYTNSTFGSGVQYSRNFGKLVRTSSNLNINQNVITKVLNGTLGYNIGMNQFNPFVPEKKQVGNWYESFRIGLNINGGYKVTNVRSQRSTSYTDYNIAGVSNTPITTDQERRKLELQNLLRSNGLTAELRQQYQDELDALNDPIVSDFKEVLKNGVFNNSYSVPISLPNFKIAKHLNLTPSISLRGDLYDKRLEYKFLNPKSGESDFYVKNDNSRVTMSVDPAADSLTYSYDDKGDLNIIANPNSGGVVVIDTVNGLTFGSNVSYGAGLNTRFYGTYRFSEKGRLQAIRHTVAPTISFNYTPDSDGKYAIKTIVRQTDSIETSRYLPRFLNSSSSFSSASSSIGLSISNRLEAKIRSKSDTAETEFEKIALLDNFVISTSYNPLANKALGEFALANINLSANTSLFKGLINLNASGNIDPYAYEFDPLISSNKAGIRSPTNFKWQVPGYAGNYLNRFNVAVSTRLSPETFNKNKVEEKKSSVPDENTAESAMQQFVAANPMAYVDFSIPWSMNISYSMNYTKQGLADSRVVQAIQLRGDLSLTPRWKVTYSTGWDFIYKAVTLTNIGMMRELHCWDMAFNWTPIAGNNLRSSNYSFDLRVRSSLLSDLKVSRRRMFYDRGGF